MNISYKSILLAIPVLWYILVWMGAVFGYSYSQGADNENNALFDSIWVLLLFFGTPITFLSGSIYTGYKKYWWWFGAYMILGGGLFACAYYARFF